MPIGNATTPALNRKVILVATEEGLRRALAATQISEISDYALVLGQFGFPAYRKGLEFLARYSLKDVPAPVLLEKLEATLHIGVPISLYAPLQAAELFDFGVGQTPLDGTIYVQHPIHSDTYVAPEAFSKTLAREKEAAFRQLASALGAKEITLVDATIQAKRGLFGGSVPVSEAAAQVGVKAEADADGKVGRQVYSRFGPPRQEPHVPDDLRGWIKMDPDLRTMERDRIQGHLLEHRLTLEFKERSALGGEIAARIAERGLTVSGAYEAISQSVWQFSVEYWPRS